MQKNKVHILSTRPLSQEVVATALKQGIEIDEVSFIETVPVNTHSVIEKIKTLAHQPITAIFTSMNAVEAVAEHVNKNINWIIYSIGSATQKLVEQQLNTSVKGTAPYAEALADVIIQDDVKTAYFFCGNIRRDALPQRLRNANISLVEIVVYETKETTQPITKAYDGILFFSPSAVQSYFKSNTVAAQTTLFAIGTTTAQAVQQYTGNNVIVAESPGKEELVQQMIKHFSQQKID